MSKPKRPSFASLSPEEENPPAAPAAALSRDNVVTLNAESSPDQLPAEPVNPEPAPQPRSRPAPAAAADPRRRSANDTARHSYHTSLYLPEEAQFALREIALVMRKAKPHDVMLEAMADMFDRYNKPKVAKACRERISQRGR